MGQISIAVDSRSIVDLKCTDQQGRIFIVEMQMIWQASFKQRLVFGATQAYVQQKTLRTTKYGDLNDVYSIAILNKEIISKSKRWRHYLSICDKEDPDDIDFGVLHFILVELPKFKVETFAHKKLLVLWIRFLKEVEDAAEELKRDPLLREALHIAELAAYDPEELASYDKAIDLINLSFA